MGYFPNHTAFEFWAVDNCNKCKSFDHPGVDEGTPARGCPIQAAHLFYNYDECNNEKSILHFFIPIEEDGVSNGKCQFFIEKEGCLEEEWMEPFIKKLQEFNEKQKANSFRA